MKGARHILAVGLASSLLVSCAAIQTLRMNGEDNWQKAEKLEMLRKHDQALVLYQSLVAKYPENKDLQLRIQENKRIIAERDAKIAAWSKEVARAEQQGYYGLASKMYEQLYLLSQDMTYQTKQKQAFAKFTDRYIAKVYFEFDNAPDSLKNNPFSHISKTLTHAPKNPNEFKVQVKVDPVKFEYFNRPISRSGDYISGYKSVTNPEIARVKNSIRLLESSLVDLQSEYNQLGHSTTKLDLEIERHQLRLEPLIRAFEDWQAGESPLIETEQQLAQQQSKLTRDQQTLINEEEVLLLKIEQLEILAKATPTPAPSTPKIAGRYVNPPTPTGEPVVLVPTITQLNNDLEIVRLRKAQLEQEQYSLNRKLASAKEVRAQRQQQQQRKKADIDAIEADIRQAREQRLNASERQLSLQAEMRQADADIVANKQRLAALPAQVKEPVYKTHKYSVAGKETLTSLRLSIKNPFTQLEESILKKDYYGESWAEQPLLKLAAQSYTRPTQNKVMLAQNSNLKVNYEHILQRILTQYYLKLDPGNLTKDADFERRLAVVHFGFYGPGDDGLETYLQRYQPKI